MIEALDLDSGNITLIKCNDNQEDFFRKYNIGITIKRISEKNIEWTFTPFFFPEFEVSFIRSRDFGVRNVLTLAMKDIKLKLSKINLRKDVI